MPKRSPWERHYKREREINRKVLDLMLSASHPCLCGHVQGFHWANDNGENVGKCADAECGCTAFDEDLLAAGQLAAGVLPTTTRPTAEQDDDGGDDALARAMRAEQERRIDDGEVWDRVLHADRPRPNGKPRRTTKQDPVMLDALRELGGAPDDLTG